jgi:hypothetical protein
MAQVEFNEVCTRVWVEAWGVIMRGGDLDVRFELGEALGKIMVCTCTYKAGGGGF